MTKLLFWVLRLLAIIALLGCLLATAQATPSTVRTPPAPPLPHEQPLNAAGITIKPSSFAQDLPQLKAVLLVGPIDGDGGDWTTREKQNMELAAVELEANGVEVQRFYTPNNDWDEIKAAAEGAHFLFYRGHGIYWSPMPHPEVGGFALKNKFVSSDDIRQDLHLAPNAVVMLYGCFTPGSSSIDGGPIGSQEAQRRVAQYSDPFLDIGTAGYYADWFGNAFQMFVGYLFQGMTLGEAYEAYFDFNSATVERHVHPDHPEAALWLDKDDWGYTQYNNAFVGFPGQTLADLFPSTRMTLSPAVVTFLAKPSDETRSSSILVNSTGPGSFNWTVSVSPETSSWLEVRPISGSSGQNVTVVITPTDKVPDIYQTQIHVTAETPQIKDGEQDIFIKLHILEFVYRTYLPTAFR